MGVDPVELVTELAKLNPKDCGEAGYLVEGAQEWAQGQARRANERLQLPCVGGPVDGEVREIGLPASILRIMQVVSSDEQGMRVVQHDYLREAKRLVYRGPSEVQLHPWPRW